MSERVKPDRAREKDEEFSDRNCCFVIGIRLESSSYLGKPLRQKLFRRVYEQT